MNKYGRRPLSITTQKRCIENSLLTLQKEISLLTLCFWTFRLENCDDKFLFLRPPRLYFVTQS